MSVESVTLLLEELQRLRLLEPSQQTELTESLHRRFPDIRDLAHELARREWVTPFQLQRICQGRGRELLIGAYFVLDRLDNGTIGPLFKARHEHMKRIVAIQVVREEWLARPEAVGRLHHDLHHASKLSHLHIAHVFDVAQMGRVHYFVLEALEGLDLDRLVCQFGPFPVERACVLIRQAALGLQYAFERNLWHHDLKPSNLFLTRLPGRNEHRDVDDFAETRPEFDSIGDAVLKIRNLGLKSLHATTTGASKSARAEHEDMGAVKSEDCLAPEQQLGRYPDDVRSNLYSLGCNLYYLLTGRVPFPGGDAREKQARHQSEEPIPVERLRPEAPPEVAAILRRLMAKCPEERFQTPGEAAEAFAEMLGISESAAIGGWDTAIPGGSTHIMPAPESPLTVLEVETPADIAELPPEPEDDVLVRHRNRVQAQKRRLFIHMAMGGAALLVGAIVGTIVLIAILRLTPSPLASTPPSAPRSETPHAPTWTYVKMKTREETILATLHANGIPTLEGKWHYIGPFDNPPEFKGFDAVYPPEKEIDLTKTYSGKNGQTVTWKEFPEFQVGKIVDLKRFPVSDWSCIYLLHEVEVDEELTLPAFFGSDDTLTVWCNGEPIWANNVVRGAGPNQDYVRLHLKPGKNRLLFKICNGTGDWAFYVCPLFPPQLDDAVGNKLMSDF